MVVRDHYLPASVSGRFSVDPATSARERVIFVGRRGRNNAFQTKAGNFGYTNDLYQVSHPIVSGNIDTDTVDGAVSGYGSTLPAMLRRLDGSESIDLKQ